MAGAVEARLGQVLDAEIDRWVTLTPDLEWPLDALRRLVLAGGKRLRPAFCHWGFVGAGGSPDDPRVIDAGAAFELLHAFALMHDDVMDDSDTRRGSVTIHAEFAARHDVEGWGGESRRFGEGVAILVGDLAHVFADRLLPSGPPDLAAVWDEAGLFVVTEAVSDPVEQRRRLQEQSLLAAGGDPEAMELDEDFLQAMEYAMPPTGGLGMGVDRVVMLITGRSIRETLPFPLAKPR